MGIVVDTKEKETELIGQEYQQLRDDEKMFRLLCETSNSAFIYYNYKEDRVQTLANWGHFFDFPISDMKDFSKLYDCVEEKYSIPLSVGVFI